MRTEIRHITKADVGDATALIQETLSEFGLTFGVGNESDAQVRELPGSYTDAGGAFFVALDEGQSLVGTAGVFPVAAATFELRKMYLRPSTRGQGLGKRLFETCVAFCRSHDARHLVLNTHDNMSSAIAFYESLGFVRDDTQMRGARCTRGYWLDL